VSTDHLLDRRPHVVIDVVVPAEFLHDHVRFDPEPLGNAELAGVSRRGGDHGVHPSTHVMPGGVRPACYYSMASKRTLRSCHSATASSRTRRSGIAEMLPDGWPGGNAAPIARPTIMRHDGLQTAGPIPGWRPVGAPEHSAPIPSAP